MIGLPTILARRDEAGFTELDIEAGPDNPWFAGHFPEMALLPGVVQIGWAAHFGHAMHGLGTGREHAGAGEVQAPDRAGCASHSGPESRSRGAQDALRIQGCGAQLLQWHAAVRAGSMSFRPCAVIPVYNHHTSLPRSVAALSAAGLPVILVDDGSDAVAKAALAALARRGSANAAREPRQGRGGAGGYRTCRSAGFQPRAAGGRGRPTRSRRCAGMLKLAEQHPQQLVSGVPQYDASVPRIRFYGRYLTHGLVWLETLSLTLQDSMCGFRVYPVRRVPSARAACTHRRAHGLRHRHHGAPVLGRHRKPVPADQGALSGGRHLPFPHAARQRAHGLAAHASRLRHAASGARVDPPQPAAPPAAALGAYRRARHAHGLALHRCAGPAGCRASWATRCCIR